MQVATRRRLLILSFSNLDGDPRVARQIATLAPRYHTVSCGLRGPATTVDEHVDVPSRRRATLQRVAALALLLGRRFETYYWTNPMIVDTHRLLQRGAYDVIVANDLIALPLALALAGEAPVLLDAHEFAPDEFGDQSIWRALYGPFNDYLCRQYLPRAAAATTVSAGIAAQYAACYGVQMQVLTNAADFVQRAPTATESNRIRMIHHGAAIRSRHIEDMIDAVKHLDERYSLDLMLVPGSRGYLDELRNRAAGLRVRFLDPVPLERIVEVCAGYDIGLCYFRPANRSLEYCLPNKFFEYVQARLAIVTGPSPDMAQLVQQFGCGAVTSGFSPEALGHAVAGLTAPQIDGMKAGAHRLAFAHNAARNAELLQGIVSTMIGDHQACAA